MTFEIFVRDYMTWVMSFISITMMWQVGNKNINGWLMSLFCQALWTVYWITLEAWGLAPLNIMMWIVSIRNYSKWKNDPIVNEIKTIDNIDILSAIQSGNFEVPDDECRVHVTVKDQIVKYNIYLKDLHTPYIKIGEYKCFYNEV